MRGRAPGMSSSGGKRTLSKALAAGRSLSRVHTVDRRPRLKLSAYSIVAILLVAVASNAQACSPPPSNYISPRPMRTAIDAGARDTFKKASYIVEAVVVQPPGGAKAPGRLRVVAIIKGQAPEVIFIPLPDPCVLHLSRRSERVFAVLFAGQDQPVPLSYGTVASLRRQRLGSWGSPADKRTGRSPAGTLEVRKWAKADMPARLAVNIWRRENGSIRSFASAGRPKLVRRAMIRSGRTAPPESGPAPRVRRVRAPAAGDARRCRRRSWDARSATPGRARREAPSPGAAIRSRDTAS